MKELNKDLREQATHLGMCDDFKVLWKKDLSREELIELMFKGIDFCLQHHFPSNDYLLIHSERKLLRSNGILVDDKYSFVNPERALILGTSEAKIRYNSYGCGRVFLRDNASLEISASGMSHTIVHLFESAYINATQSDMAKVVIISHSPKATIIADKNITIHEEYDFLF